MWKAPISSQLFNNMMKYRTTNTNSCCLNQNQKIAKQRTQTTKHELYLHCLHNTWNDRLIILLVQHTAFSIFPDV